VRKRALLAVIAHGVDADTALGLIGSVEQGIQRLAVQHLCELHPTRPPEAGFLQNVVAVANHSDDIGLVALLGH
jgi:hypothetical protein